MFVVRKFECTNHSVLLLCFCYQLSQRMDALNLNNSTPNSLFPASNQFEMNGGDNQQQKNLNQSVPTSNFWQ